MKFYIEYIFESFLNNSNYIQFVVEYFFNYYELLKIL